MKILCTGDWHISEKTPENRTDDFLAEGLRKVKYILDYAAKNKIHLILQPGDLTDSPFIPYTLFVQLSNLLFEYKESLFSLITIYGQHDLRYRRKEKTPLFALNQMSDSNIFLLGNKGTSYEMGIERVNIYGCSFGEQIPEIITSKQFNILLIHRMIIDEKLWAGQEEYITASKLLKTTDFDLIVSGDNHQTFTQEFRGKNLLNMGSLMRSNIKQLDHKPCFSVFDTITKKYEVIYVPITSSKICFKKEQIEKEKERNSQLERYILSLNEESDMGVDFIKNLFDYVSENKIDGEISKIFTENLPNAASEIRE